MASPRPIWAYDKLFFDIVGQAIRDGTHIAAFDSAFEARAFRSRLYAFREALLANPEFNPKLALISPRLRFEIHETEVRIRYVPTIPRQHSRQRFPKLPTKVPPGTH